MKLGIDSSSNAQLILYLDSEKILFEYASPREQDILQATDTVLRERKLSLHDLSEIEVVHGPGKFTSLRVGIAVAQALSFALQIPINGNPAGSTIDPVYGAEPNITRSSDDLD